MATNFTYRKAGLFFAITLLVVALAQQTALSQGQYAEKKGYGKASYNRSQAGKYMHSWLVAGPFAVTAETSDPDDAIQEKAFKTDKLPGLSNPAGALVPLNTRDIPWQPVTWTDDIVNLDSLYKGKDYVYAYAIAEIKASTAAGAILAVGSDDGIKVWLNGKLVHENWIPRAVEKDNDLIPLKLVKGSNQLVLKVQDMQGGWGFTARLLDKPSLTENLNGAASSGNLEKIKLLIEGGADPNAASSSGITPLMSAKISGRNEAVQELLKIGAKDQPVPSAEMITDNLYSSLKGKEAAGIAILVAKDGNIVYKKGFGYAQVKNKVPVTPETIFRIGSVTKQFTAAAILKLQENNLLSVDDKVSKFIPDFPRGDEVTIHQLLTHTSGIHSYTGRPDFVDRVTKTITPDSLIHLIESDPYDFNPGERFLYNNSGYFMLGYIIGKVSGKPYATYLKETFFDPLGMNNTGVYYTGIKLKNEATGYSREGSQYEESLNWDMSWAGAAGAMYSTVDDLLKWNQALYNGKVLSEKSFNAAITPVVLKGGEQPSMQYGYGLGLNKYRGIDIIGHSGGLHGFLTQLVYYPKEKLTVVMFTNTSNPEINFNPDKVAEAFLWDKMEAQASYAESTIKPKDLTQYAGRFELLNIGVLTVTTNDNKLFAQLGGQPRFEIFPSANDEFFWKVVEARIKFGRNEKGEVDKAVLYQNGQEMKARKLEEETIITLDPAVLDNYAGKYKLNENITVQVFRENNKLIAHPTGQSKVELQPVSETDFVVKELNAKIKFIRDEKGKVKSFKLDMNGVSSEAPRIE